MKLIVLLLPALIIGADVQSDDSLRESAKQRIGALSAALRYQDMASAAAAAGYAATRDKRTNAISSEVDDYLRNSPEAIHWGSSDVASRLAYILQAQEFDPEYAARPFAQVLDLSGQHCILIGYMLSRGGVAVNDSAVTFRGYRVTGGRLELTATSDGDLDGFGFFAEPLASPDPREAWVLAWGSQFGFNGRRVRVRIYVFDGHKIRKAWAPDDLMGAKVSVTPSGISIEHLDEERYYKLERPPYTLRDEYIVTSDGPRLVSSSYIPE